MQPKSPKAKGLYAKLSQKNVRDKASSYFNDYLKPQTRAMLLGILKSKL